MIDLHCHLLPGIDDGARDMRAALDLARVAVNNGITHAVMTPHIYAGRWDNSLSNLRPVFNSFQRAVNDAEIPLEIFLGGEVHLLPDAFTLMDAQDLPHIGVWRGYKVILLELPDSHVPVGALKAVDMFIRAGYLPMIAHPERNKEVMRNVRRLEPLLKAGCLVQLTAASVCGKFGAPARKTSLQLLDNGWATVVATDAHNLAHRPPIMAEARAALNEMFGEEAGEVLTHANPRTILEGREEFQITRAAA